MFRRVLVANRGEIARRIIKTINKMGIQSVAVFSEADADAGYLNEATHKICIGPALSKHSYLLPEAILEAALLTDCEAIHPGFGFLSENATFAARCGAQKLTFIGPSPKLIDLMGDKDKARQTMLELGIPTLLGSKIVQNAEEGLLIAKDLGFPVLLKARSGGGGKGMRLLEDGQSFDKIFLEAKLEAQSAFNDGELYIEKFIKNARHIEFQILADNYGHVECLFERECSVQRRNQKLLEEAPANNFPENLREKTVEMLKSALSKIGYSNAGTVEFLLSEDQKLYFMEMNTRIQVEHPVTELITGIDIVEWQVRIACGEKLQIKPEIRGHAIECRINAEDSQNDFLPSPGLITRLSLPKNNWQGPVRIDTHVEEGFKVAPFYDSMLAKVITHGKDRHEAIDLMKKTLDEIKIEGVKTTLPFHQKILAQDDFLAGNYDCSFIPKNAEKLWPK
jgi:acetyl-CoA carboxylase biotin carboxylase subunit